MYKIIQNNKVIDVVKYPQFVSFLASGHITMTDKTSAEGIVGSDNKTVYSFIQLPNYDTVTIEEVNLEELEGLQSLLGSGQKLIADDTVLADTRRVALRKLSNQCKNKIISGFSVVLSDDKVYNFKLTTEDQLNLMSIEGQLNAGAETFIYHATDLPCRVFSRDEMTKVINAFRQHITYHTTYFNVAKQYINSLIDIGKINEFAYGNDLSAYVNDSAIKQILKNGADQA